MYWSDMYGDGCEWYYGNEDACGMYSEDDIFEACCACTSLGDIVDEAWDAFEEGDWEWAVEQGEDYTGLDGDIVDEAWGAFEDQDWEWAIDQGEGLAGLDQGETSWSVGPITVTYDSAAAKIVTTVGAAALAVALFD